MHGHKMDYMMEAIKEAKIAASLGEVPVGAVIVYKNEIIAKGHNFKESLNDVTMHAEAIAIKKASIILNNWRLCECSMYVTLEPCPFCTAIIGESRIKKIYVGTHDTEKGACGTVINILNNEYLKYKTEVNWLYNEECSKLLSEFFQSIRSTK